jgi:predicted nucleotidyltransferase
VIETALRLLEALRANGVAVTAAYLYGSQAGGDPHAESDIDVAVVSAGLSGVRHVDWFRLNSVASRIDVRLEVIGFRPEQFRDENPLAWEVKTEGLKIA